MSANNFDTLDSTVNDEEPAGAERYLNPGENLRICSSDIQIKKIRFESYLTNKRLFLIDQNDRKSGITAKEIPIQTIVTSILEESPSREPVLVLSVRTSDDDVRTMKLVFMHTGEDRGREAEEWVHLIAQTASAAIPGLTQAQEPATAPEARPLTDTMILPASRTSPPVAGPARAQSPDKPAADQAPAPGAAGTSLSSTPRLPIVSIVGRSSRNKRISARSVEHAFMRPFTKRCPIFTSLSTSTGNSLKHLNRTQQKNAAGDDFSEDKRDDNTITVFFIFDTFRRSWQPSPDPL